MQIKRTCSICASDTCHRVEYYGIIYVYYIQPWCVKHNVSLFSQWINHWGLYIYTNGNNVSQTALNLFLLKWNIFFHYVDLQVLALGILHTKSFCPPLVTSHEDFLTDDLAHICKSFHVTFWDLPTQQMPFALEVICNLLTPFSYKRQFPFSIWGIWGRIEVVLGMGLWLFQATWL